MRSSPRLRGAPRRPSPLVLLALVLVALGAAGCEDGATPGGPAAGPGTGPAVVVPIGSVPAHAVRTARTRLGAMGFPTTAIGPIPADPTSIDVARGQRIADVLLDQAVAAVPGAGDGDPMVVALTGDDIYMAGRPGWAFVFSLRGPEGAILSTARMDPRNLGGAAAPGVIDRRLDTMLVRVVGLTRLGVPTVGDPTCANRESVLSVDDLDAMRPVLCG